MTIFVYFLILDIMYKQLLTKYKCVPGKRFAYNSASGVITYVPKDLGKVRGNMALLHEIAHAKLGHKTYKYDLELLKMEEDAWNEVKNDSKKYTILIDEEHIEECLSTYREWISKRSSCPKCKFFGKQMNSQIFHCKSCKTEWKVNNLKDKRVMRKIITPTSSTCTKKGA